MSAEYLVTGGAGFIGSNICKTLIEQGKSIRILDNFSTGKWQNLEAIKEDLDIIEGDIRAFKIGVEFMVDADDEEMVHLEQVVSKR